MTSGVFISYNCRIPSSYLFSRAIIIQTIQFRYLIIWQYPILHPYSPTVELCRVPLSSMSLGPTSYPFNLIGPTPNSHSSGPSNGPITYTTLPPIFSQPSKRASNPGSNRCRSGGPVSLTSRRHGSSVHPASSIGSYTTRRSTLTASEEARLYTKPPLPEFGKKKAHTPPSTTTNGHEYAKSHHGAGKVTNSMDQRKKMGQRNNNHTSNEEATVG